MPKPTANRNRERVLERALLAYQRRDNRAVKGRCSCRECAAVRRLVRPTIQFGQLS